MKRKKLIVPFLIGLLILSSIVFIKHLTNRMNSYIEKNGKQEYVGKIVGDSSVDACFSYDDSYIEKNGKPISISLPLEEKTFDEKRTRYFFEGLLPEGFTRKCLK